MYSYIANRLLYAVYVVLGVLTLVVLAMHLTPGDPVDMLIQAEGGGGGSRELAAQLRARYGLDQPLYVQYVKYVTNAFQLDLGNSIRTGRPVLEDLKRLYPATFELTVASLLVATILGAGAGILAALKRNGIVDNIVMTLALMGVSLPGFLLGLLLMLVFALQLGWLPPSGRVGGFGWDGIRHLILPATTLGVAAAAIIARLVRSAMLDVLSEDYVRTARAKGLSERIVVLRHALKNALIPIVTVLGLEFGGLLSGAIIAETIFAWPGLGRYLISGITGKDFPTVQGAVIAISATFVLVNLVVDLIYTALDPRVQYQ